MKKILLFIILLWSPSFALAYQRAPVDITTLSIAELQEAVEKGYLTYERLTQLFLERIEAYDRQYHTLITINDQAIETAKKLDQEYQATGRRTLLHGIPIIVKDNIDVVGMPTTAGSIALAQNYPHENAFLVEKLMDAGAIILAKANMSEFAFSATNSLSSYGPVHNAYDLNYTSYGSSGGSAVAMATRLAVLTIGTDTNSSIRVPASAAGVFGLRPTFGLVSQNGILPYDKERDTAGILSPYIEDIALVMDVIADRKDIESSVYKSYTASLGARSSESIRVGVLMDVSYGTNTSSLLPLARTDTEIAFLFDEGLKQLENSNVELVPISDFYNEELEKINNDTLTGSFFCHDFNQYIRNTSGPIQSFDDLLKSHQYIQDLSAYNINCNGEIPQSAILEMVNPQKAKYEEYVRKVMEKYQVDALVYPTTKHKVLTLSQSETTKINGLSYIIAPTLGWPAINLPLGFDNSGLAYGMELLATSGQDDLLLELAYRYQQENPHIKLPEITPPLYTIPDEVIYLKQIYENGLVMKSARDQDRYYQQYLLSYKNIYDFFQHYNEIENIEAKARELANQYQTQTTFLLQKRAENIEIKETSFGLLPILVIVDSILLLLIIILVLYHHLKKRNE